jgi:hypothetical protein
MSRPPKHGARQLERLLKSNGLDRRTLTGRHHRELIDALAAERGGWGNLTVGERLLIERAASLALICRTIETYVFNAGVMQGNELAPVLARGFATYSENLRRCLLALGLKPDVVERLEDIDAHAARLAGDAA